MATKTTMAALAAADWQRMERDVVARIRLIASICKIPVEGNDYKLGDKIASDLLFPALELLGQFCGMIEIENEGENQ